MKGMFWYPSRNRHMIAVLTVSLLFLVFATLNNIYHANSPSMTRRLKTPDETAYSDLTRPPVLNKYIKIVTRSGIVPNEVWTKMNTSKGRVDVLVYPAKDDVYISTYLISQGAWEPFESGGMERLFTCDKELGLIDIGANIGVYVLLSAMWGRPTVGIEPNLDSIARLYKSVERNKFEKLVTLVRNAVFDSYATVQLGADSTNRGNTVVGREKNVSIHALKMKDRLSVSEVDTVLMDDLIPLVKFKRAILKVDIEGSEPMAFAKSSQFFSVLNIPYIFMEWKFIKRYTDGGAKRLYTYFISMGYVPYWDPYYVTRLNHDFLQWPTDVFWLKGAICAH